MRKVLKSVGILVMALGLFFGMSLMSFAADGDIAGGVIDESYGQITWRIDKNGHLTVEGWGEYSDPNNNSWVERPWVEYHDKIITATVNIKGTKKAKLLFAGCENLEYVDLREFDASQVTTMYGMFLG